MVLLLFKFQAIKALVNTFLKSLPISEFIQKVVYFKLSFGLKP